MNLKSPFHSLLVVCLLTGCLAPPLGSIEPAGSGSLPSVALGLHSFSYVTGPGGERFDLSGLIKAGTDTFFLVNDKSSQIFRARLSPADSVAAESAADLKELLPAIKSFDLESIRSAGGGSYLIANEATHQVILWNPSNQQAELRVKNLPELLAPYKFDRSFGMEAVCPDGDRLYVAKEKGPALLLAVTDRIETAAQLKVVPADSDITDCLFRDGTLYLLNRNNRRILLAHPASRRPAGPTFELFEQWDFSAIEQDPRFQYWMRDQKTGEQHDEWGTAEALDMDDQFVYIGLDNNGQSLRQNPRETRPVILVFNKPGR